MSGLVGASPRVLGLKIVQRNSSKKPALPVMYPCPHSEEFWRPVFAILAGRCENAPVISFLILICKRPHPPNHKAKLWTIIWQSMAKIALIPSQLRARQRSGEGVVRGNGCPKGCLWRVRFFAVPLRFSFETPNDREETDSPKTACWTTVSPHDAFSAPLAHPLCQWHSWSRQTLASARSWVTISWGAPMYQKNAISVES